MDFKFVKDIQEVIIFENKNEVLNYIDENFTKRKDAIENRLSTENFENKLGKTPEEIIEEYKTGNKNYTLDMINNLKDISGIEVAGNNYEPTDDGLFYDIDKVVTGEPENMLTAVPEKKKYIKVAIDVAFCSSVNNKIIANRGIAIFKLLYTLMTKGAILDIMFYSVFVPPINRRTGKRRSVSKYLHKPIKTYCEIYRLPMNELNLENIMFYCSPEFFRGITFITGGTHYNLPFETTGLDTPPFDLKENNIFWLPAGYTDERTNELATVKAADDWCQEKYNNYLKEQNNEY